MAAQLSLQSKYKLMSGHEIPVLGYGVSYPSDGHSIANMPLLTML